MRVKQQRGIILTTYYDLGNMIEQHSAYDNNCNNNIGSNDRPKIMSVRAATNINSNNNYDIDRKGNDNDDTNSNDCDDVFQQHQQRQDQHQEQQQPEQNEQQQQEQQIIRRSCVWKVYEPKLFPHNSNDSFPTKDDTDITTATINNNNTNNQSLSSVQIVVTSTTNHFRHIARNLYHSDNTNSNIDSTTTTTNSDHIVEIGCSTGGTSKILWDQLSIQQQRQQCRKRKYEHQEQQQEREEQKLSLSSSTTVPSTPRSMQSTSSSTTSSSSWIGIDTSKSLIDQMQQRICMIPDNNMNDNKTKKNNSTLFHRINRSCICMNPLSNPGAAVEAITNCFSMNHNNINNSCSNNHSPTKKLSTTVAPTISPTIVFMDIGGNRDEYAVLRMLSWIITEPNWLENDDNNRLRLIVVKSEEVVSSLLSLHRTSSNNSRDKNTEKSSCNDTDKCIDIVCDANTGVVQNGDQWMIRRLMELQLQEQQPQQQLQVQQNQQQQQHQSNENGTDWNQIDNNQNITDPYQEGGDNRMNEKAQQRQIRKKDLPKHPLRAPKRYRPISSDNLSANNTRNDHRQQTANHNINDDEERTTNMVLICRYHNYHVKGCCRYKDKESYCPYDHEYCHICLQKGHIARHCPSIS